MVWRGVAPPFSIRKASFASPMKMKSHFIFIDCRLIRS